MYNKIIYFCIILYSIFFITGCNICTLKKESISEEVGKETYLSVSSKILSFCSIEEAKLAGLVILPYSTEQRIIKDSNFYIADMIFSDSNQKKEDLFFLLKQLYIADGWTLAEERIIEEYSTAVIKKVNKEIYIFIQNKEKYNKKNNKYIQYIFVHQSMLNI